ncbi:ATP-dependent RNA helicase HrpA [Marihabitans asiaticum]|uniref:ATP-dependent helicase HrpA n=1 Tax=Marihabitans asiaticum TaxID=415218 RepID=A0A560WAD0_9MICO|nr:ATP-dependent RNA helicase HrpA [Marihabitans asiaticum]TWD14455.1 ATP-dependent helicase HrpA [Marihabitans asiaticum]
MPGPLRAPVLEGELHYPPQLPVVAVKDEIAAAVRDHQVVVIAGETGSGKTTQLPKIALEIGRGQGGQIGHTQPRRIAARSVAERIAQELQVDLGGLVGYQVRFADHSSDDTAVKVMTDGILLSEMQRDRDLRRYDTLIIDEAHERSLNIDFILGYLKALLPRRPDLKVIITSATIDPDRFAAHFADADGTPAPVLEVSGRTYPVEVRYRPLVDDGGGSGDEDPEDREAIDQTTGICRAVEELWTEPDHAGSAERDVLVFLSGEREIRDAADALTAMNLPGTEVLPLFARLSAAEQHRVFARHSGRRIVLATNVAETSLTVPGIRYVIDTGVARISRYSQRTKVQRLPIEPISQASADQRAGRCGRVSDGICIRLYSEEDYQARPEFTDPEILRTSLASVILSMTSLGLGDVARFPFVEPPDSRQVADGMRLLEELQAVHEPARGAKGEPRRLTRTGRTLARLPVDPRLGRMLIEADRLGCLTEVLVVVSAMSIQDPRERPLEQQAQADQQHARFRDEHSDFAGYWKLWTYLRSQQKALSSSAFRRMCKREYLHYLRIREWQDLHSQLRRAAQSARMDTRSRTASKGEDPDFSVVHQALLAGLLSHVGVRDEDKRDYLGARGARFSIQPGSTLFRRQPQVVMAGELVETTRLWARTNAAIDPAWAERLGAHLVKRSYSEPRWSKKQASAIATERVTLYGVPLVAGRTVQLSRIDPVLARELFLREGIVAGDWDHQHEVLRRNARELARIEELEARTRRRGIAADEEDLLAFYDARVPQEVVSGRHFDRWWKQARRESPELLTLAPEHLVKPDADTVDQGDYPTRWQAGEHSLRLTYQFEPGTDADGVTVHLPVHLLNQIEDSGFDWQVPGLREELATALIRSLPKATRRSFAPAPDHARRALVALTDEPGTTPFAVALGRALKTLTGIEVPPGQWDPTAVPTHLRMTFRVEGERGRRLAEGTDLAALRDEVAGHVQARVSKAGASLERAGLTDWDLGELPATVTSGSGRAQVVGYPALVDEGSSVAIRVLPDWREAEAAGRLGVRRLLLLGTSPPWKRVLASLSNADKLALGDNPHGSVPALLEDCLGAAVDDITAEHAPEEIRDREAFDEALRAVRTHLGARTLLAVREIQPILVRRKAIHASLDRITAASLAPAVADMRAQLDGLVGPGFVTAAGLGRLSDLTRYLRGIEVRLERLGDAPARDAEHQRVIDEVETEYADLLESLDPLQRDREDVRAIAWQIEELRVSLFAQSVGAVGPVSAKRVRRAMAEVRRAVDPHG